MFLQMMLTNGEVVAGAKWFVIEIVLVKVMVYNDTPTSSPDSSV